MSEARPWSVQLHVLVFAMGTLLLLGQALWFYLMGSYHRILLPLMLAPLMLLATLLQLGREGPVRLSAYLVLICGYLLIAVELPAHGGQGVLWLGLPPVLTLLLLPLGPAMLLNVVLAPVWLILLVDMPPEPDLVLNYLTLVVVVALVPWEILRQKALLQATDPGDPECRAFNRDSLHDRLYSECQRAEFLGQPLCILLIHLPQVEMAGEQFGQGARLALLDVLCSEVEKRCRFNDLLGREGNSDFWLLLPDTSENGGLMVRQRLDEGLRRSVLLETGQLHYHLTLCPRQPQESAEHLEQRLLARTQKLAES